MRTKNGKRIGPVPIALVAVLALAAFISAGLWLVPSGTDVTEAQSLPGASPTGLGSKCEVTVHNGTAYVGGYFADGGCVTSDDSIEVKLLNKDMFAADNPGIAYVSAYVTGGQDYGTLQAMDDDGEPLGAAGINEYNFAIGAQTSGQGGRGNPGSESITVERSMAKDGQVYVFVYNADATGDNDEYTNATDPGNENAGIPLSVLVSDPKNLQDADVQARALQHSATLLMEGITADLVPAATAVLETDGTPTAAAFNSPVLNTRIVSAADLDAAKTDLATMKALVDTDTADTDTPNVDDGGVIKIASDYIAAVKTAAGNYTDSAASNDAEDADIIADGVTPASPAAMGLMAAIKDAEMALARVEAVVEALDGLSPTVFPEHVCRPRCAGQVPRPGSRESRRRYRFFCRLRYREYRWRIYGHHPNHGQEQSRAQRLCHADHSP